MFAKSLLALSALLALVSPDLLVLPLRSPNPRSIPRDDTSTCKVITVTVEDSGATSTARL
ncbi:hypothetical protein IEO21_08725 [Rhodonia placenta]|uniref:Uncharacterized protein n=1 Tax=Rhodonia placenta TaxID=104341 RepID=A0A8H7TYY1_9APHY|nr:hypothetical protein IEO21_08725 [Postia placenta]